MRSPLLEVQKALYQRLSGALSCAVYDHTPQEAPSPFVSLGQGTARPWGAKLLPGAEVTHTVHVWSAYEGYAEAKALMEQIVEAVLAQPLQVQGWRVVSAEREMEEAVRDPDGWTHGVLRFRFRMTEV